LLRKKKALQKAGQRSIAANRLIMLWNYLKIIAYDTLKNKIFLENFNGKKPIIIEQDSLSTVCLYNITQDILLDAEMEQQEKTSREALQI